MTGMDKQIRRAADLLRERLISGVEWSETCGEYIELEGVVNPVWLAESLHEAGLLAPAPLREVTTAAELDTLPVDTVVVDTSGVPRTKRYPDTHMGGGWTHAGRVPLSSQMLADGRPLTVVYVRSDRADGVDRGEGDGSTDQ